MPALNVTESVVALDDNLVLDAPDSSQWVRDVWPGIATVITVSAVLVLVLIGAVIYKMMDACRNEGAEEGEVPVEDVKNLNASGSIYRRPSVCSASPTHKWVTEDNPHNKWFSGDYDNENDEEQEEEPAYYQKRLLRTSVSE